MIIICPCCKKLSFKIIKRPLNTAYVDEESNYLKSCPKCFEETIEYYNERWSEYYSGFL